MIVSNTTPISNLLHVDKIFLLAELFGAVYIPKAVANEVNVAFSDCGEWRESLEGGRIIIQPILNTILARQMVPLCYIKEKPKQFVSLWKRKRDYAL